MYTKDINPDDEMVANFIARVGVHDFRRLVFIDESKFNKRCRERCGSSILRWLFDDLLLIDREDVVSVVKGCVGEPSTSTERRTRCSISSVCLAMNEKSLKFIRRRYRVGRPVELLRAPRVLHGRRHGLVGRESTRTHLSIWL